MMRNNTIRSYLIHVLIPFLSGIILYLLGRSLVSLQVNKLLKLNYAPPPLNLPEWLIFNVPDGLWLYSFLMWLILIWQHEKGIEPFVWYGFLILGAIGSEFMQKFSVIQGTYDSNDIYAYFLTILLCAKNYYQLNMITQ